MIHVSASETSRTSSSAVDSGRVLPASTTNCGRVNERSGWRRKICGGEPQAAGTETFTIGRKVSSEGTEKGTSRLALAAGTGSATLPSPSGMTGYRSSKRARILGVHQSSWPGTGTSSPGIGTGREGIGGRPLSVDGLCMELESELFALCESASTSRMNNRGRGSGTTVLSNGQPQKGPKAAGSAPGLSRGGNASASPHRAPPESTVETQLPCRIIGTNGVQMDSGAFGVLEIPITGDRERGYDHLEGAKPEFKFKIIENMGYILSWTP